MKPADHPQLLSPFTWAAGEKYRAVLSQDLVVDLCKFYHGVHLFVDRGQPIAELCGDRFTLFRGYASDLCSPAIKIGKRWIGTPTSARESLAAFVHDGLRQLLYACPRCVPWTRKDTDDLFYDFMVLRGSRRASIYHGAVAGPIGSLFMRLTAAPSTVICTRHP